jgi:hypothetical protein
VPVIVGVKVIVGVDGGVGVLRIGVADGWTVTVTTGEGRLTGVLV